MPHKFKSLLNILFIFLTLATTLAYSEVVDKIVVVVNDEIITQGELDRMLLPVYKQYKGLYAGAELEEKLEEVRRNILNRLIEDKLLLSEVKRRKIEITDEEVKAKLDDVKSRFATDEEFEEALASENILLSDLEKNYKERIAIDKMVDSEIRKALSISPHEVIDYYKSHQEEFNQPAKVKLWAILLKTNESRSEEEMLRAAKELLGRLEEGADFKGLAKTYSEGPYRESGGDMGWVRKGELMKEIDELVFSLEEGETSGILKTSLGLHIFKIEEKMPSRPAEFQEVRELIEEALYRKKTEEKLKVWIHELKKNAYIAFR